MRLFTLSVFLFLTAYGLFAQTVTISEALNIRSDMTYDIIGQMDGNLLLFRDRNTAWEVQAYDHDLELSWKKELELDKKRPRVIGLVPGERDFTVLYSKRDHGEVVLKAHRYDAAANLQDSISLLNFGKVFHTPFFQFIYSEDRSHALVYYIENGRSVTAACFNMATLKMMWHTQFKPNNLEYPRDWRQIIVANNGDMHLILEKDNRRTTRENHHYEIYRYGRGTGDKLTSYVLPLQGKLTYDVFFEHDDLNDLLVAGGLYSMESQVRSEGYFYLKIPLRSPNQHLIEFHEFDDTFVADLIEKSEKKAQKGLTDGRVQKVVLRRDGGILILGERVRTFERTGARSVRAAGPGGVRQYITDYYFEDLFVISVHPNGQEHWHKVLHKKQYSQDDDAIYSSFFLAKTPQALRLLFNDEIKAENTVSEYIIDGGGSTDRNSVFSTQDQALRLRFRDAVQVAANELVVPSERRSKLQLVRVRYD